MAAPLTAAPRTASTTYEGMLERIRYDGAYPTREHAERVVTTVLTAFGPLLPGTGRARLAARLPAEGAAHLMSGATSAEPPTGWDFVKDLADRTGHSRATTRWDVGTVLLAIRRIVGEPLTTDVLTALPAGWSLLFGRAEPARPQAA